MQEDKVSANQGTPNTADAAGNRAVASGADDPVWFDLCGQSDALAQGRLTSVALTQQILQGIERHNAHLNCYLALDAARAIDDASASDQRRATGRLRGPLDGLTIAIKDNINVAGLPTTAGMATRRGRVASADAFVVAKLRAAGAIVTGKLNMHEGALGATSQNPHYGDCHHPYRHGFTPGGSSGGSACAVAAGLPGAALGTDTMGSVRIPAAYCGLAAIKPSYGLLSAGGSVACCYRLDHIGPIARSARDLRLLLPLLAGFDPDCPDAREVSQQMPQRGPGQSSDMHSITAQMPDRLTLLAPADLEELGVDADIIALFETQLAVLASMGHVIRRTPFADYDFARARRAGLLVCETDMLIEHAADRIAQPSHFSPALRAMLDFAAAKDAASLARAHRTIDAAVLRVRAWFVQADFVVMPTAPQRAFDFTQAVPANQADLTSIANMTGIPAVSVPMPVAPGTLPVGLQIIGSAGTDMAILQLAIAYQQRTGFVFSVPPMASVAN